MTILELALYCLAYLAAMSIAGIFGRLANSTNNKHKARWASLGIVFFALIGILIPGLKLAGQLSLEIDPSASFTLVYAGGLLILVLVALIRTGKTAVSTDQKE